MASVDVILQENFLPLGYIGDKVSVSGGYARNYLIPKGIAISSTPRAEKQVKHKLSSINAKKVRMRSESTELQKKMEGLMLSFSLRMAESGKAFGAVTSKEIEAELKKHGFVIDRRQIVPPEPLKKAGEFKIAIKLHPEVTAKIQLAIKAEVQTAESEEAPSEGKARRASRGRKPRSEEGSSEASAPAAAAEE